MADQFQAYEEAEPDPLLADFVKRFWRFSNPTASDKPYTILPDGYFDLIVKVRDKTIVSVSLFGLCSKELAVSVPAYTTVLGVCFKPLAADYILHQPIADILNGTKILLNNFWGVDAMPLNNFENWTAQITDRMLLELRKNTPVDTRRQAIFTLLFESNGMLTVKELADKLCWNSRQINRYFTDRFGLSVKAYGNVLRCFAAYTHIRAGNLFPTADFYDQSHFIKEIKKHTGVRPGALYQNENDRFLQFSTLPDA